MFKVGDEVFIKGTVEEIWDSDADVYPIKVDFKRIGFAFFGEEELIPVDKTYTQGLADAWNLARKMASMEYSDLKTIFGNDYYPTLIITHTAEEALAKIEAYEKEKEIKVGDVVKGLSGYKAVVTVIGRDRIQVMFDDGSHTEWNPKDIKKTGKHIDIESLLKKIGE